MSLSIATVAPAAETAPSISSAVLVARLLDRVVQRLLQIGAEGRRACPGAMVTPAAIAWPPPLISRPVATAWRTAAPRSTPVIERPEPVPMPPGSSAIAKAGRPKRSFSRAATSPTTPGCQPCPAVTTTAPFSSMPSAAIASASASRERLLLDRLPLAVEPVELGRHRAGLASASSSSSSRAPRSARPMRPPALMRGPSRKPRCQHSGGPVSRAASISAVRPTCSRRRIAIRPFDDEGAVEPLERHHVGDGAERHQVEQSRAGPAPGAARARSRACAARG